MLKKAKAQAAGSESADHEGKDGPQSVLDSSRQIWLAGLGAFSRAQAEGMKVFEKLVEQGESLEKRTRRAASETAAAARGAAAAKAKEMQAMAGGTWDKLEQVFEERVERALSKLGVYTQNDVTRLSERVDALSEAVNALIKQAGGMPGAGAPAAGKARKPARGTGRRAAKAAPAATPAAAAPGKGRKRKA